MTGALRSKYALGELIGEGRAGSVYRVHRESGEPELVIKVLRPELAEDPDVIARARHLSGSLRSLRNPHLVAVDDIVIEPEMLGIVTEFVAGGTLADYLKSQPKQPESTALSLVQQVLAGLAIAHGRGFFHGHLTAQQVLLASSPSGEITARVSDLATRLLVRATRIDDDPTASTDLYAVGALLHEMLTGKPPVIRAGRLNPTLRKPAAVSPPVWDVVTTLLARDEVKRPTNTWKELTNVERVLDSMTLEEPPVIDPPASSERKAKRLGAGHTPQMITRVGGPAALSGRAGPGTASVQSTVAESIDLTQFEAPMLTADITDRVFDIQGVVAPPMTPSITNIPVLPDRVDGWVGYVPPPPKQGRIHRWIRTRTFVAVALLAIGGILGGAILGLSGGTPKPYTYFSVDTSPIAGLQVTRSWTLTGGKHPNLHVLLEFHTSANTSTMVEELLPTSLLTAGTVVTFHQPLPTHIDGNHVVTYQVDATGLQVVDASYDVAVPPKDFSMSALLGWAYQQRDQVGARYRAAHALASISLPKTTNVTVGKTILLGLTGMQKDGNKAPGAAFGGATYRIDNGRIASISRDGKLKGLKVGRTWIHVNIGTLTATSTVYVKAAAKKKTASVKKNVIPAAASTGATASASSDSTGSSNNPQTGTGNGTGGGGAVGTATQAPHTTPTTGATKPPTSTHTTPPTGGHGGGPTSVPTTTPVKPSSAPPTTAAPSAGPTTVPNPSPTDAPPIIVIG